MSAEKKCRYLLYSNRAVIYALSLIGIFYQVNLAYVVALTLWVWLPQCMRLELRLFKVFRPLM